ncbi:MAG TPA: flavodoxin domain-containing protein [Desulfomicrobiaceae bacterium]|nr:flavodoxin domain-containing protein [Desulfomicrobiaceae bacterium]
MPPIQIKENIYWVGVVDWNEHDFHGYSLARKGTSYNAYLVLDEKITLFDSVPEKFKLDLYHQIRSLVKLEDIDIVVANHIEPDHSGALPWLMDRIKPEKLYCSTQGKAMLLDHFHQPDWPYEVVKTGDSMSIGKRTVQFMETRMLHWPDSMFSYIPEDKLLISNDAFGLNKASSKLFDDEHDLSELMDAASHYYHNIILPFSPLVQKVLARVSETWPDIDMIAPDHGVVWRSHVADIVAAYDRYSRQITGPRAVIAYDTMWKSTEKMAKAVADGMLQEGIEVRLMNLKAYHHSDVMAELADATAIVCGCPTHNNGIMPVMADFLTYMKGLKPSGRVGAAFGSYGWSGESVKHLNEFMEKARIEMVSPGVRVKNVPTHESLAECVELGRTVARAVKARIEA